MSDKTREYIQMWLDKANSDLKTADIILAAQTASPPLDTVCFHCQQAVEKFIVCCYTKESGNINTFRGGDSLP